MMTRRDLLALSRALLPTLAAEPPQGAGWVHEIKHGSYRADRPSGRRDGAALHPPRLAVTASKLRTKSFTLGGEAVVCGPDGIAVFERACVRCHLTTTSGPAGMPVIGLTGHMNGVTIHVAKPFRTLGGTDGSICGY
jgi:hypothetical protein